MEPLSSSHETPGRSAPIAVIGDAYLDEIFAGDQRRGPSTVSVGGAGVGVATDLALLGIDSVLIASIGDDEGGERIREHLREHDIGILPTVGPQATGHVRSVHVHGHTVERYDEATRSRRIGFNAKQRDAIEAAPFVVVAGFAFDDKKQQRKLLAAVHQPQNRLVLDPNPREGLFNDQTKFRVNFERHASSALLVHLGTGDADLIFHSPVDEVTSDLLDLGAANVLATEALTGSRWVNRTGIDVSAPIAFHEDPVVDTRGAGDAVLAVAVATLVREGVPQRPLEARAMLLRAMELAAVTVRNPGPNLHGADAVPIDVRRTSPAHRLLDGLHHTHEH